MHGLAGAKSRRIRPGGVGLLALVAAGFLGGAPVRAQYYDGPRGAYGGPPAYYDDDRAYRPGPRRAPREAAGLNCAAVQDGLTGPKPYSCPLPEPRPLGVRCFCNLPIASFSPAQTAVGRVVP